ncbi:MAG: hypothetical protein KDB14_27745 [Planctomycetales bacterium]|nr:hypothetical protein [Planctomycetales bacterium]
MTSPNPNQPPQPLPPHLANAASSPPQPLPPAHPQAQPAPPQAAPAQPVFAQPVFAQPMAAQPAQPASIQPMPVQAMPAQPMPVQPMPVQQPGGALPLPPHLAQPTPGFTGQAGQPLPQPYAAPAASQPYPGPTSTPTGTQPLPAQWVAPPAPAAQLQHQPQYQPQPVVAPAPIHPGAVQPQQPQPIPLQQPAFPPAAPQPMPPSPVAPVAAPRPGVAPAPPSAPRPVPVPAPPTTPAASVPQPAPANRPVPVPANRPLPAPANRPLPAGQPIPVSDRQPIIRGEAEDEDAEEGEEENLTGDVLRAAPPWLVSLVVHMGLLIVLALIALTTQMDKSIEVEVVYSDREGEQLEDDSLDMFSLDPLENLSEPIFSKDLMEVSDPLAAPPDLPTVSDAAFNTSTITAPSIGMALTGREKGAKSALLAAYGGTKRTEAAVANALKWLKKQQRPDGSWSLKGPYADAAINENRPSATAMALLAFQGAGNTHLQGEYKLEVSKGKDALLKMMDADGSFYQPGESPRNHRLYTQAQCTIALCELFGMTKDPELKAKAQLALDYAARIQSPEGGWRYTPGSDADTSVTGWFVMALQSGLMASELAVKQETLGNITRYLDTVQHESGAKYAYLPQEGPTLAMSAEGLLCRQYLGWPKTNSSLRRGVDYLLENLMASTQRDVYYWYYATQVLHHMGGEDWDKWNDVMREYLPSTQVDKGPEAGSWDPARDAWGHHGGRLYVTCLSVFMLEVYYRHLPIYKHF